MVDSTPPHECAAALEKNMCDCILDILTVFYADQRNIERFEQWLKAGKPRKAPAIGGNRLTGSGHQRRTT